MHPRRHKKIAKVKIRPSFAQDGSQKDVTVHFNLHVDTQPAASLSVQPPAAEEAAKIDTPIGQPASSTVNESPKQDSPSQEKILLNSIQQAKIIETFSSSLKEVDSRILGQFQVFTEQSETAFIVSLLGYIAALITSVLVLGLSFYHLVVYPDASREIVFSIIGFIGGLLGLVATINRSPIKSARYLFASLVKLNVLFLGYLRQIHLIDATFQSIFLYSGTLQMDEFDKTIVKIRQAIDQTLDEISQSLEEMDN